jgi:hypothetical protein
MNWPIFSFTPPVRHGALRPQPSPAFGNLGVLSRRDCDGATMKPQRERVEQALRSPKPACSQGNNGLVRIPGAENLGGGLPAHPRSSPADAAERIPELLGAAPSVSASTRRLPWQN